MTNRSRSDAIRQRAAALPMRRTRLLPRPRVTVAILLLAIGVPAPDVLADPDAVAGRVEIMADQVKGTISPMIYGQMIEQAYWSVHLGLWTQMLDNGGFEQNREGGPSDVAPGWKLISTRRENMVSGKLDDESPYNARRAQRISIKRNPHGEVWLLQGDLALKAGAGYRGFVFLRGAMSGDVSVCLLSLSKQVIAEEKLGAVQRDEWTKFAFTLLATEGGQGASFAIVMNGEGTLWVDQAQLYPADSHLGHGTRADIVRLYKDLKPAFIRWPGGAYLMWHHWKNGVGPLEDRYYGDGRVLRGHDGEWDPNSFGTDEFIQLCRDLDTEPMLNVNIKDGLQNTLDWIEYCNGGVDTKWGALRARHGHQEPYRVRYWVVDNEPLAATASKGYTKETFPGLSKVWAEAMKRKDPGIEILVMGNTNVRTDHENIFNTAVIAETKDVLDHFCTHCYYDQVYEAPLQGMPYILGERIAGIKKVLDQQAPGRGLKVALSEWNPQSDASIAGNMGQALEAAQIFNELERRSAAGAIDIATPCQLAVNTDRYRGTWLRGAMVQISSTSAWTSPMYHVNRLFSHYFEADLLELSATGIPVVESRTFAGTTFPALDFNATKNASGTRMIIKAVNASDRPSDVVLTIASASGRHIKNVRAFEVAADTLTTMNTADLPTEVVVKERDLPAHGNQIRHTFRPYGVTLLEISLD